MNILKFLENPQADILLSDNYLVADYETTNINKGDPRERDNRIIVSSWKVGKGHPDYKKWGDNLQVRWGNELEQGELIGAIERCDLFVAQNTKFELQWSGRAGLSLDGVLPYCTILGEYCLAGNRRRPNDLNAIARRYGVTTKEDLVSLLIKSGICPSIIPAKWLEKYVKQDVLTTESIFLKQRLALKERGLLGVALTKNLFTPVLADMEMNGLYLDKEMVDSLHSTAVRKQVELHAEIDTFTGGINTGSPVQMAHFLYGDMGFEELKDRRSTPLRNKKSKQFPEGQPKTDVPTLEKLVATTERQRSFIALYKEVSKVDKSLSTYLSRFKDRTDNYKGHLYGRFNQAITQTHRLSSSRPNFQNFDSKLKRCFTARRPGWVIGERDAAQLEFRIATCLGRDTQGHRDIEDDFDVHKFTADTIGCERTPAKRHTFKPLYGGTSGTPAERRYYRAFREKYSGITSTQDGWVDSVLNKGTFTNVTGLKFYFPHIRMTSSGYVEGNTNVRNYPIQYLATGEIIPIGVTYLWHKMQRDKLQAFMVNTVHDSVLTEEPPEETSILDSLTEEAFSVDVIAYMKKVYNFTLDVPLDIETTIGQNWNE